MKKSNFILGECVLALFLIFLDQFTKHLAVVYLYDKEPVEIIKGVFELHYLKNMGAAFGIFQNKQTFFIVVTLLVLAFIVYCIFRLPEGKKYSILKLTLILLFSGATGNLIDRAYQNYVTDFFYFKLINFPIFNVADIYVVVSVIFLAYLLLFIFKDEDMDEISESLKGGHKASK